MTKTKYISSSTCKKLRKDYPNFECNPPNSCFECPFPDCIAKSYGCTKLEIEFLKSALDTKSKRRYRRND